MKQIQYIIIHHRYKNKTSLILENEHNLQGTTINNQSNYEIHSKIDYNLINIILYLETKM